MDSRYRNREGLALETVAEDPPQSDAKLWIISAPEEESIARTLARCLSHWRRVAEVGTLATCRNSWKGEDIHVVSVSMHAPDELHSSVELWAWPLGLSWTPCTFQPAQMHLDVGPVFRRGYTPTFAMLRAIYGLHRIIGSGGALTLSELAFWCNILARSVLFFEKTRSSFYPSQGWLHHDLGSLETRYRRTFCPSFRPDPLTGSMMEEHIAETRLFEAYANYEQCAKPSTTAGASASRHIAFSLQPVFYPHSQKTSLEQPHTLPMFSIEQLLETRKCPPVMLDISILSAVLLYGAGIKMMSPTQDAVKRFASTAGNLGSCELGFFSPDSEVLPRGLYRYRSVRHDLAHLQSHRCEQINNALEQHLLSGMGSPGKLLFFLCGKLRRLCEKYGAFGYKLMYLDAGVIFSQLKLLAHAYGYSLCLAPDLGRRVPSESLHLANEDAELIGTAILTSEPGVACVTHDPQGRFSRSAEHRPTELFLSADALVRKFSRDVLLIDGPKTCDTPGPRAVFQALRMEPETRWSHNGAVISLQEVLQRRTSVRTFSAAVIPEEIICDLLLRAHRADVGEWSCVTATFITFFVLYGAASPAERRLFRFDPTCVGLTEYPMPLVAAQAPSLYADAVFQAGPLAIWAVGDLATATRERGLRGHQELLLRAGAALNRIWLMGIGRGVCGCISAGVVGRTAHRELGFDGWHQLPLCTLLLGYYPRTAEAS